MKENVYLRYLKSILSSDENVVDINSDDGDQTINRLEKQKVIIERKGETSSSKGRW